MSILQEKLDYTPEIHFKKTHEAAKLPTKNNPTDTGYDIYAVEDKVIPAHNAAVVETGLQVAYIPAGYWFQISPRSGLGFKNGIQPHLGVIDNPYRGNLGVKLFNFSDVDYNVKAGDRIAQFIVHYNIEMNLNWGEVQYSTRGAAGFGSSGK